MVRSFTVLGHSHFSQSVVFCSFLQLWSKKKKRPVHDLLSTKHQTDTLRDKLVNIVEHLAAKETDIYLRSR